MVEMKPWYQSKTVWGGLVAVLASGLRLAGVDIGADIQGDLADAAVSLAGSLGGLLAIYGRFAAKAAIARR